MNASTGGRGLAAAPVADPNTTAKAPATAKARPNTLPITNPTPRTVARNPAVTRPSRGMLARA